MAALPTAFDPAQLNSDDRGSFMIRDG